MATFWAILFTLILPVSWLLTLLGLPGNWIMVAAAALYVVLVPAGSTLSITWPVVAAMALLAALAELIEFLAGALGVAKAGGSRRSALFALVGSFIGGVAGLVVGAPIPVVGSVIAALFGASLGALVGAVLGEQSQGGVPSKDSLRIGVAAFWGRLLGTAAKSLVGLVIALVAVGALLVK